jgi:hypothetical protein
MLSRALSLATVTLLIGCLTAGAARAVENLDRGKSPSQIFSNTCSACHKSPRGLLKNTSPSSLPGFLRQHYTTGTDMASVLSSYLISNGAADPRYQGKDQAKQKDAKQDGRPDQLGRRQPSAAPPQEASRPDADGAPRQGEGARPSRDAKRFARPQAAPDADKPADGQAPVQATTDSKPGVRQKQGRRGKPAAAEEPPKAEQAAPGDAAKEDDASRDAAKAETAATDPAKTDAIKPDAIKTDTISGDTIKGESDKPAGDAVKPAGETEKPGREGTSDTAKVDAPKENAGSEPNPLRPDPVPPVTPAPPASAATAPEPGSSAAAPAAVAPAGPPVPPISR